MRIVLHRVFYTQAVMRLVSDPVLCAPGAHALSAAPALGHQCAPFCQPRLMLYRRRTHFFVPLYEMSREFLRILGNSISQKQAGFYPPPEFTLIIILPFPDTVCKKNRSTCFDKKRSFAYLSRFSCGQAAAPLYGLHQSPNNLFHPQKMCVMKANIRTSRGFSVLQKPANPHKTAICVGTCMASEVKSYQRFQL